MREREKQIEIEREAESALKNVSLSLREIERKVRINCKEKNFEGETREILTRKYGEKEKDIEFER